MLKLILLAALVAISCAVNLNRIGFTNGEETAYRRAFESWVKLHGKTYNHDEFHARFNIFKNNFKFVQAHDPIARGFNVSINAYADLTGEEFARVYNGLKLRKSPLGNLRKAGEEAKPVDIPKDFDWRTKGAVTSVKNQGQCGSCWSFSTTGSTEGAHFLKTGKLVGLSEQNLMDCSTSYGNQGCNGGLMDDAFEYIIANHGIDTEASYPYQGEQGSCQFEASNVGATISSYKDIPSGDEESLLQAASLNPISVAIDASHMSFQFYDSGVYYEPDCSSSELDHGVLVAGWGVENGKDYWLVKNSWGPGWGLSGYIKMSRNKNNNCGIATSASYPII